MAVSPARTLFKAGPIASVACRIFSCSFSVFLLPLAMELAPFAGAAEVLGVLGPEAAAAAKAADLSRVVRVPAAGAGTGGGGINVVCLSLFPPATADACPPVPGTVFNAALACALPFPVIVEVVITFIDIDVVGRGRSTALLLGFASLPPAASSPVPGSLENELSPSDDKERWKPRLVFGREGAGAFSRSSA